MTADWALPWALDAVADCVPDRDMLVWTTVRRTYAEVRDRTRRLASFLHESGLGAQRDRSELERWECGQSRVAIVASNCPEYIETMIGAYRARAVPFNVNHGYGSHEIAALLRDIGADAVVYHRRFAPLLADDPDLNERLLVDIDDRSGVSPLHGSRPFESVIDDAPNLDPLTAPSPDDLYMVCTGGTTGAPKGVLWRQADVYVAAMGGAEAATRESITATAEIGAGAWFAAPPLMHGAAQWTAFACLNNGGTVVLHDDSQPFEAATILRIAEQESAAMLTIVGDAYARPLVEELKAGRYDLSSLKQLSTGGAVTSTALKHALLELVPNLTIVDGYGASETGGMAFGASKKGQETREFSPAAGATVISEDRTRFLQPGDDEIGWTARTGRIPLGYLNDAAKTEQTFPVIAGQRVTVPGDRARYVADGRIEILGRNSLVVNTGGEKVFVEEVEEALRQHPDILDALVVGRPHERFGEVVVALVQLRPGAQFSPGEVRDHVARKIARFKAPRAVLLCDHVRRHPSGKADYTWARQVALDAVTVEA